MYLAEGKNHVVLKQVDQGKPELKNQVLRIRKCQNQKYYTDPLLIDELEYNHLFIDHLLMKNPVLHQYVQGNQMIVKIEKEYVQAIMDSQNTYRIQRLL